VNSLGSLASVTETIRLGRLAGVRVGLHWSVLVVVALLVLGLGLGRFPVLRPDYPLALHLAAGVAAALLFLGSLLAHELAHAVVARRNRVEVEGITLWLLGGVAQLRGDAATPGAAFRIAAVGPATSAVLGGAFWLLTLLVVSLRLDPLLAEVLSYLALVNLLLAAFNLVPAAPLDGGRILRAALWAWRGDPYQATVWSAWAGRGFGYLLIGYGGFRVITADLSGLWYALLGLFVVNMASAEERQARVGAALAGLRVGEVMTPHPETATGDSTVGDFLRDVAMLRRHSAFPLVGPDGGVQGMITMNRLRGVAPELRERTRLREVACPPEGIPTASPDEPLSSLLYRMDGCTDGRALVFDDGRLVGIVSPSDISRTATWRGIGVGWRDGADLAYSPGGVPDRTS
jgi:Zn-dependent protease